MSSFINTAPADMHIGAFDIPSSIKFAETERRPGTHEAPLTVSHNDASALTTIIIYIIDFTRYLGFELLSIMGMVFIQLLLTYLINRYHGEFSSAIRRYVPSVLLPFVLPAAFIISRLFCIRHPSALRVIDVIEEEIQMRETPSHRPLVDLA